MMKKKKITKSSITKIKTNFKKNLEQEIAKSSVKKESPQRVVLSQIHDEIELAINSNLKLAQIARIINQDSPIKISTHLIKNYIKNDLKMTIFKQAKKTSNEDDEKVSEFLSKFED